MKKIILSAGVIMLLGACGTTPEPTIRTVTVTKPVPVACVPNTVSPPPEYPDSDEALRKAPDAAERYRLVFAGRLLRDARLGVIEPIIQTCREEPK